MSDADGYLERTFMSPASVRAGLLIREWMEDAGLKTLAFYLLSNLNHGFLKLLTNCYGDLQVGGFFGQFTWSI